MSAHHSDGTVWGTTGGMAAGMVKGFLLFQTTLTWEAIVDTIALAAIGAIVGFLINLGLNWIRNWLKKIKK